MTEKSYGGNNGVREHTSGKPIKIKDNSNNINAKKLKSSEKPINTEKINKSNSKLNEIESYKKAGEISIKIKEFARQLIKPNMLLVDIAQKIEEEIIKQGAQPAFPVNLSIDDVAAHYHPTLEDETKATGLLKVDIGVHINGFIADSAISIDLTPEKKHTDLIKASEEALENALSILHKNPTMSEIGETIQKTISKKGFSPVINLSGHGLGEYDIHAGVIIPNNANNNPYKLEPGAYAIEPFATYGEGKVMDGPPSNIYKIINPRTPRSPAARAILEYIWEKNETLPFSLRELQEKFGNISRLAIKELEQNNIIHNYPQLIEISHKPVSQAEHTFIKTPDNKIIITTK
ncbi:type II methionyl aminopeptidase [Candidatus Pacearchaeota archaeon]|nr:type II methionyl aminopeptidase [Candidatus Pacearchaeota archaeon]